MDERSREKDSTSESCTGVQYSLGNLVWGYNNSGIRIHHDTGKVLVIALNDVEKIWQTSYISKTVPLAVFTQSD